MAIINTQLIQRLQLARDIAGIPFSIRSGTRCEAHNQIKDFSPTSSHLSGKAVDIYAGNSSERFVIVSALIRAGIQRIGISKTFIHADIDDEKPPYLLWLYPPKK